MITRALKRRAQNRQNYPGWELSWKCNRRRWSGEGRVYIVSSPARHPAFQTNAVNVQRNTVACKKTSFEINQSFVVLPALHSVLSKFPVQVTSGISISTLEIRQERTSRFYLRVEWTSTFGILAFTDKHIRQGSGNGKYRRALPFFCPSPHLRDQGSVPLGREATQERFIRVGPALRSKF